MSSRSTRVTRAGSGPAPQRPTDRSCCVAEAISTEPAGLRRARELLTPEAAARAAEPGVFDHGYLDLLPDDLESTGATQDLMTTSLVPAIYERYWRPALARVAKGVTGPGMAEEVRIARLL